MATTDGYAPYIDENEGFSDDHLLRCAAFARLIRPVILKAIDNVPHDGLHPFVIGDFATGDGCVSLPNIKEAIRFLRTKYEASMPIQIVYEDQPLNNYNLLVRRIHGLLPQVEPDNLNTFPNVFVMIVTKSFYEVCVPHETLLVGFSTNAMHYLQTIPCNMSGAIHSSELTAPDEIGLFRRQAADEWEKLLLARAKELAPGGHFIIGAGMTDDDGQYMGKSRNAKGSMFQLMTSLWKRMLSDGKITQEEFDDTNFKQYYRTEEEFRAPFQNPDSEVSKAGLELVSIQCVLVRCPYHEKWMRDGDRGDANARRRQAKWFLGSIRYWTNWVFMDALSKHRSGEERKGLVDLFYTWLEDAVTDKPDDYHFDEIHSIVDVRKKGERDEP